MVEKVDNLIGLFGLSDRSLILSLLSGSPQLRLGIGLLLPSYLLGLLLGLFDLLPLLSQPLALSRLLLELLFQCLPIGLLIPRQKQLDDPLL